MKIFQCDKISNDSLIHFKNVKELSIGYCEKINDEGADYLRPNPDKDEFGKVIEFTCYSKDNLSGKWVIKRKIVD